MRNYELMFVVQPDLDEEGLSGLVDRVQQVIVTNGGQIVHVEIIGRRNLAYPIRKYKEGYYVLLHAGLDQAAMAELERMLRLSEDVLRHLLFRLDEVA